MLESLCKRKEGQSGSFVQHKGIVVPLDRINVDTDAIMPKEFIKRVDRTGYGQFLFYYWRYLPNGNENTDFILNQEPYRKATILLARKNFGCGSSRNMLHGDYKIMVLKC